MEERIKEIGDEPDGDKSSRDPHYLTARFESAQK